PVGPQCRSAPIVSVGFIGEIALVVCIFDDCCLQRETGRDLALLGRPTYAKPAIGTRRCGSRKSPLTTSGRSRMALIGQQPRPTAVAAHMKAASTIAASTVALNASR